jgi:hypothetical protein
MSPDVFNLIKAAPRIGAASGAPAQPALPPIARTPQEALRLPRGAKFRTPGGRIKLRP